MLCFAATGAGAMESAVSEPGRRRASPPSSPRAASSASAGGKLCDPPTAPNINHIEFRGGTRSIPSGWTRPSGELASSPAGRRPSRSQRRRRACPPSSWSINEVVRRPRSRQLCVDAFSGPRGFSPLPQRTSGASTSSSPVGSPSMLRRASPSLRSDPRGPCRRKTSAVATTWICSARGAARQGVPPYSAFTPAVTLFRALDVALDLISRGGARRHAVNGTRSHGSPGWRALGMEALRPRRRERRTLATWSCSCPSTVMLKPPKLMRYTYGVTIAGGQGHLKGQIARIAHCGYYGAFDIVVALTALRWRPRSRPRYQPARVLVGRNASSRRPASHRNPCPQRRAPTASRGSWSRRRSPTPALGPARGSRRRARARHVGRRAAGPHRRLRRDRCCSRRRRSLPT